MNRARLPIGLIALSSVSLSACASLGTNISGSFDCKAPGGSCAPTSQIDAAASAALLEHSQTGGRQRRAINANSARTGEQLLKIVFPAFVDAGGNLHEARSVHVVARSPDWVATLAGRDDQNIAKQMAREISNQTKKAQIINADDGGTQKSDIDGAQPVISGGADPFLKSSYNLPSRSSDPLTAREAIAGASMPVIEGFGGLPPPKNRTPHPHLKPTAKDGLPSTQAIEAAKARGTAKRAEKEKAR